MNTINPYVRTRLRATRKGIPDPRILVEGWLDRLEAVLALQTADLSEQETYELLAMWAKLQRVRPELIDAGDAEMISQAATMLGRYGSHFAQLALNVPNPKAWRQEAEKLDRLHEETDDPVALNTLAEELIEQLDDAELVLYAAGKQGLTDEKVTSDVLACRDWLIKNAHTFVCAGVYIQAAGMTLKPDLAETDYDLALTALKYEALLDAIEDAEAQLQMEYVVPLPADVAEAVRMRLEPAGAGEAIEASAEPAAAPAPPPFDAAGMLGFPATWLPQARLAADRQQPTGPRILEWRSPQRDRYAAAAIPEPDAKQLTVAFFNGDGSPAVELAGTPVCLAGIKAVIAGDGTCSFPLEELIRHKQELKLEVGADRTIWRPATD